MKKVVLNKDEAVKAAEEIGFPVMVKGLGVKLLHKTEFGLVHLLLSKQRNHTSLLQGKTIKPASG